MTDNVKEAQCLTDWAQYTKEIQEFVRTHEDVQTFIEMMNKSMKMKEACNKELKNVSQTTGDRNFVSKDNEVSTIIDLRQPIKGADIIRDHWEVIQQYPLACNVTKEGLKSAGFFDDLKAGKFNIDMSKYLQTPTFVATTESNEKAVKGLEKKFEHWLAIQGIHIPKEGEDLASTLMEIRAQLYEATQ